MKKEYILKCMYDNPYTSEVSGNHIPKEAKSFISHIKDEYLSQNKCRKFKDVSDRTDAIKKEVANFYEMYGFNSNDLNNIKTATAIESLVSDPTAMGVVSKNYEVIGAMYRNYTEYNIFPLEHRPEIDGKINGTYNTLISTRSGTSGLLHKMGGHISIDTALSERKLRTYGVGSKAIRGRYEESDTLANNAQWGQKIDACFAYLNKGTLDVALNPFNYNPVLKPIAGTDGNTGCYGLLSAKDYTNIERHAAAGPWVNNAKVSTGANVGQDIIDAWYKVLETVMDQRFAPDTLILPIWAHKTLSERVTNNLTDTHLDYIKRVTNGGIKEVIMMPELETHTAVDAAGAKIAGEANGVAMLIKKSSDVLRLPFGSIGKMHPEWTDESGNISLAVDSFLGNIDIRIPEAAIVITSIRA